MTNNSFNIVGNLLLKVDGAEAGLNKLKTSLSQLKLPANLDSGLKKSFSNLDGLFAKYRAQLKDGFNTKGDVTNFAKTGRQIEAEYDRISAAISKVTGKEINLKVDLAAVQNAEKEIERLVSLKEKLSQNIKGGLGLNDYLKAMQASDVGRRGTKVFDASNMLQTSLGRGDITKAKADVESLISELNRMSEARKQALEAHTKVAFSQIIADLRAKVTDADQAMTKFGRDIETTSNEMSHIETTQLDNATKALADITSQTDSAQSGFKQLNGTAQETANSMFSMTKQLGDLQQSTQYFFSLRNMISLFRRGIDDAIQSVKELDKAMTDTAVVTDYKVSDMWDMLPQYTQIANELGATTQGAYETMTLYFQQGLDQQQAFELGAETMKMARIAGLDYAETTDMMTAALRGFNMELNETSARRINDVYSKLAAVTASDTEELGTAMQRTASIAHSAGMSFEGTTAFLAQAIETTREPAENIGTAMKTIIARFQEMKKNPLEISEVEGEEVDFNKVDAALKTIGVDLKDTNGQFRELDKVFLDISSRWNNLSQTQQRYIATVAAGSRQQSRFIAMMDNYDRTMELVNAANNSAGASNEQFNKTMDSLEAKLNKLHNAWQAFTMGIANNGMIKLAVDGVTNLLTVTNQLINTLSLGSGTLKSFLSIFMAFNGLKATGKIANALIGGLGGMVDPQSSFSAGFRGGAIGKNSAQAINQPIVQELQSIRSLIAQKINQTDLGKGSVAGPYDEYNRFKRARANINDLNENNTVKNLTGRLTGLSGKNQNLLMRGSAAHFQAATNSLINSYDGKHSKAIKAGERFLNDQRKSAQITAEEYYTALQDPGLLKQAMVKAGVQQDNPVYAYMNGLDEAANIRAKELQNQAIRQAKYTAAETGRGTKEVFDKITQGLTTDRAGGYFKQKALAEQGVDFNKAGLNITKMGKLLDGLGSIGTGISQAGMGIQAFGGILMSSANPALQAFGSALSSVGGLISGLGMSISGISSTFTAISGSKLITNIAGTGTVFGGLMTAAGALTGGLLLLGGVIAALVIGIKKHNDNIKKAAEEVSTKYQEKNEKAQTNISNLQSWREDFARLSSGVDANGYNINLSTEDYDRYLEITRGIAEINPSIVEGYNAQGQAIITNNKALEETLELEKQHQQEAFRDYTSPESLKKLIAARDLAKQAKTLQQEGTISQWGVQTKTKTTVATGEVEFKPQANMRKQAQKIGEMLQKGIKEGWATDDLLADFNIDIGKLAEGDEATLNKFNQFGPKIQQRINDSMDSAGDSIKEHTKNTMLDAFSGYSDAVDELDELITPTYNALLAATSETASSIPSEFKKYFNEGLKDIASDANIQNPLKAAEEFAGHFKSLTKEGGDYYKVLQDIEKAQDDYATTLDKDTYDSFATSAVDRLNAIRDQLGENIDLTQGYGKAIDEFINNEIEKVTKFTQEGAVNLKQALNTMVDEIAAAEGALENFNKIAEGSYYGKAASNMSQIYESATEDVHTAGEGDQVFWAGAEALVGRENLIKQGEVSKEGALKQMKAVQEMLKGGQEGWDAFKNKWFDTVDANAKYITDKNGNTIGQLLDKNKEVIKGLTLDENGGIAEIDENLNPKVYDQVAEALNMSKESLIAMLNLGRQFGEISFTNIKDVRKALATDEATIKTASGKIFAKEDYLNAEMTAAGLDLNKQEQVKADLHDNYNVDFIKAASDITKSNQQFTEMGITNMESLVKTFDATGQYTKDEIAEYAEKYAELNNLDNWENAFNTAWEQNQNDQEYGGIPNSLTTIESILSSIDAHLASQSLAEGRLDQATASEAKKWLYGEQGEDTSAQKFWKGHGSGANGEITTSEFNKTSKELTDFITKGTDYVNKLEQAKQTAIDNKNYEELGKITQEQAAYEQMLSRAQTYLTEGTETYNNQIQTQLDAISQDKEVINSGLQSLFSSITPESINTDAAQSTLNQLYEAAINNTPAVLTDGLMTQMKKLGIDIQKAIDAGLVVDENGILDTAEQTGKETAEAGVKGNAKGQQSVDTTPAQQAGEQKGKETGQAGVQGNTKGQSSIPHQVAPGMPSNVPSNATLTPQVDSSQLDEAQKKTDTLTSTLSSGANYTINVTGTDSLKQAATDANKLTKSSGTKTVGVKTSFDAGAAKQGVAAINGMSAKIKVGATVDPAIAAARRAQRTINNMSATIDVSTNVTGQNVNIYVTKHVKEVKASTGGLIVPGGPIYRAKGGMASPAMFKKRGTDTIPAMLTPGEYVQNRNAVDYFGVDFMRKINHKDLIGALKSFGSAAKGRYGRLGPKGRGGLTLTGELGYEVAWIPSENRSMILGANGPQMANLPADAIVWDHKQSKKILNQDAIPAGSHYTKGKMTRTSGGGGSTEATKKTKAKKKKPKKKNPPKPKKPASEKAPKTNQWSFEEVVRFDIDQNLLKLTSQLNKLTKEIDKNLKKIGNTAGDIGERIRQQTDNLKNQLDYHQKELESYQRQQVDMGKFTAKISYNAGGKKDKDATIKFSDYMDKINGVWVINEAAVKAAGNIAKQEAIYNTINGKIKEINDGLWKEQDTIFDLQNQIEDNAKKVADAFYLWENELTEVYDLSQQIAAQTAMQDRFSSQVALELARLNTGFGDTAKSIAVITKANERNNQTLLQQIQTQKTMIEARERELDAFATGTDELEKLAILRNKEVGSGEGQFATQEVKDQAVKEMEQRLKAVEIARSYFAERVTGYDENNKPIIERTPAKNLDGSLTYEIDWAKFNQDALSGKLNEDTAKSVKDYFEKLNSANVDYNNAIKENTDTIKSAYDKLKEYQDYIVDFEDTLLQQLDEQLQNEIDNAEKLGSTITTSLKDLLDEVKRKLDERRKQEDNAKTERDISQKQQRLAALRADTSGGHQVEIAQLQKEIAEAQQSYGRTLEDQLLDRLQQQGDEAAKQRERQIELAQATLQVQQDNNKLEVQKWLNDPTQYKDNIKQAWMEAQNYDSKGLRAQEQLNSTFNSSFAELAQAVIETETGENKITGQTTTIIDTINDMGEKFATPSDGQISFQQQVTDALGGISTALSSQSNPLQDVAFHNTQNGVNNQGSVSKTAVENLKGLGAKQEEVVAAGADKSIVADVYKKPSSSVNPSVQNNQSQPQQDTQPISNSDEAYMDKLKEVKAKKAKNVKSSDVNALFDLGAKIGYGKATVLQHLVGDKGVDVFSWKSIFKAIINAKGIDRYNLVKTWPNGNGTLEKALKTLGKPNTLKAIKKQDKYKKATALSFKTGGIADYTGPAWLDGTPSKPELVLNSTDTKNFLALRDVLSSAMSSIDTTSNSYGGDTMYEININVDHLNNDYDVDKVVEKVKKEITKGAGYRNVTQVRNFR